LELHCRPRAHWQTEWRYHAARRAHSVGGRVPARRRGHHACVPASCRVTGTGSDGPTHARRAACTSVLGTASPADKLSASRRRQWSQAASTLRHRRAPEGVWFNACVAERQRAPTRIATRRGGVLLSLFTCVDARANLVPGRPTTCQASCRALASCYPHIRMSAAKAGAFKEAHARNPSRPNAKFTCLRPLCCLCPPPSQLVLRLPRLPCPPKHP
jgi:hypothetical protein